MAEKEKSGPPIGLIIFLAMVLMSSAWFYLYILSPKGS